jgi:hypothetical protein
MFRCRHNLRCPPASAGWWMRLFVAVWFIACVNYVPVHLVFETHLDDLSAEHGSVSGEAVCIGQADHDDEGNHAPHLASDHALRVLPHAPISFVASDAVPIDTTVAVLIPQTHPHLFLTERQNPPGIPPPDPLQPRAPPLA